MSKIRLKWEILDQRGALGSTERIEVPTGWIVRETGSNEHSIIIDEAYSRMYENPESCLKCGFRADCDAYWMYCPYDTKRVVDKKKDVA